MRDELEKEESNEKPEKKGDKDVDEDEDRKKKIEATLSILGMEEMAPWDEELHHRVDKNWDLSVEEWKNFP